MLSAILTAAGALGRNRLRTALTTLAIGIGIAAVISTVALGAGSSAQVQQQIDDLGEDFIWIEAGSRNLGGVRTGSRGARTLTADDAATIERTIPEVWACSPQLTGREQLIAGNQNWNTNYRGVTVPYFAIRRWKLQAGAFFTDRDVAERARVVVLGPVVAERLFGDGPAVGQPLRLGRFPYVVAGVLQPKGTSRGSVDRDDAVFLPFTTAQQNINGQTWVDDVMCAVESPAQLERAEFQIATLLRARHDIPPGGADDFELRKPIEMLEMRASAMRTMAQMLIAIGAVSLVVGGVGIMNIMLVSVTERTREIGIRLAIGARVRDIRLQFLVEAIGLGLMGGLFGVGIGWLTSALLAAGFGWPVATSGDTTLVALAVAVGSGVIFGYYPAHHASQLDPIVALRAES